MMEREREREREREGEKRCPLKATLQFLIFWFTPERLCLEEEVHPWFNPLNSFNPSTDKVKKTNFQESFSFHSL
jgi:hypothetical protein